MNDHAVRLKLQEIAKGVSRQIPGRAFAVLVWPSAVGEQVHYVGNASRESAVAGMKEFIERNPKGPPTFPSRNQEN